MRNCWVESAPRRSRPGPRREARPRRRRAAAPALAGAGPRRAVPAVVGLGAPERGDRRAHRHHDLLGQPGPLWSCPAGRSRPARCRRDRRPGRSASPALAPTGNACARPGADEQRRGADAATTAATTSDAERRPPNRGRAPWRIAGRDRPLGRTGTSAARTTMPGAAAGHRTAGRGERERSGRRAEPDQHPPRALEPVERAAAHRSGRAAARSPATCRARPTGSAPTAGRTWPARRRARRPRRRSVRRAAAPSGSEESAAHSWHADQHRQRPRPLRSRSCGGPSSGGLTRSHPLSEAGDGDTPSGPRWITGQPFGRHRRRPAHRERQAPLHGELVGHLGGDRTGALRRCTAAPERPGRRAARAAPDARPATCVGQVSGTEVVAQVHHDRQRPSSAGGSSSRTTSDPVRARRGPVHQVRRVARHVRAHRPHRLTAGRAPPPRDRLGHSPAVRRVGRTTGRGDRRPPAAAAAARPAGDALRQEHAERGVASRRRCALVGTRPGGRP